MTDAYTSDFAPTAEFTPQVTTPEPVGEFTFEADIERANTNFRRLRMIEESWQLPELPPMVKAGLMSMPGADDDSLTSLLMGIDEDVRRATERREEQRELAAAQSTYQPPEQGNVDQARIIMASLASSPPPTQVAPDAVRQFKLRAIDRGYLDMSPGDVDDTWAPEFNRIRGEMAFDDYNRAMRGDRPGAVPLSGVLKTLHDFTAPTGLLASATELNLFWDFGQIGSEMSTWGDKWRKVATEKSFLGKAKAFVDAVTGPIDDIVFPVLNVALMFTGVGAVWNAARVGWMGSRMLQSGSMMSKLWNPTTRIGTIANRAIGPGRNLDDLARPGLIAERLRKGARDVERGSEAWSTLGGATRGAARAGDAMAAWRGLRPVVAAKHTVQQAMRPGMAHQLQTRMPGFESDGFSMADLPGVRNVGEWMYEKSTEDPRLLGLELAFAPYNIFTPGTFFRRGGEGLGLLAGSGSAAFRALGSAPGRAAVGAGVGAAAGALGADDAGDIAQAAAIGAGAGVLLPAVGRALSVERIHQGFTGALLGAGAGAVIGENREDIALGALAGTGFAFMPNSVRQRFYNQIGVSGLDRAIRGIGHQMVRTSYQAIRNDQQIMVGHHRMMQRRLGASPADLEAWNQDVATSGVLTAHAKHFGVDENTAAATITFGYVSAAIDHIASAQSGVVFGDRWQRTAHSIARSKIVNQLRPIDLDVADDALIGQVAKAMAWTDGGGVMSLDAIRQRTAQLAGELDIAKARAFAENHNERVSDTVMQLFDQRNFPDPDLFAGGVGPRNMLGDDWANMSMKSRAAIYQHHADSYIDTMGDWAQFTEALGDIRGLRADGTFDFADLIPYVNRRGRPVAPKVRRREMDGQARLFSAEVMDELTRLNPEMARKVNADPLSAGWEEGRFTVMKLGSPTKQQLQEIADEVADIVDTSKALKRAQSQGLFAAVDVAALDEALQTGQLTNTQIVNMIRKMAGKHERRKDIRKIVDYITHQQRQGRKVSMASIDKELARRADDLIAGERWEAIGMGRHAFDESGKPLAGVDGLTKRLKDLRTKVDFTAAEVDLHDLIGFYDELAALKVRQITPEQAAKIRSKIGRLRAKGDATSFDAEAKTFREAAERMEVDVAAKELGDSFAGAGLSSAEAAARAERLRGLQNGLESRGYKLVHGAEMLMPEDLLFGTPMFADVTRRHLNAASIGNFFERRAPIEAMVRDDRIKRMALAEELQVSPESSEVNNILYVLNRWVREEQQQVTELMSKAHTQNRIVRTAQRLQSSFTPVRLDDAGGFAKSTTRARKALREVGITGEKEDAVIRAMAKFRVTEWEDMGAFGVEQWLRTKSVPASALKMLGASRYGDNLFERAGAHALTGAAVGGVHGAATSEGETHQEKLVSALKGAAIGGAIGAGVATGAGVAEARFGQRAANWRYGYLADGYARLRDSLRFTLSPIFDMSRFTEGHMLAQTAAPLRRADGTRIVMPLRGDPRAFRRRMERKLMRDENLNAAAAKDKARDVYERNLREFNAAAKARGDHDLDAIDSTGKWFRQYGIMGFSPTDWMATAYANLRVEGISAKKAYEAAREMYNYGARGRSGAELTANYIFFPFSFQKKAFGHIAKWMNDDLGRSLIIHDALKTYEILDEEYDLDSFWKDHIPVLQQMQRLNLFAYGISPGRFGGINSRLFEGAGKLALNAFLPAGVKIADVEAADEIQSITRQMFPLWNDVNWMVRNLAETQHIAFSPSHSISAAQVRAGYDEWYKFKDMFEASLAEGGYTLNDISTKPWLSHLKEVYDRRFTEIGAKYPAWQESRSEAIGNAIAINAQREDMVRRIEHGAALGIEPTDDDRMVYEFEQFLAEMREQLRLRTGSTDLTNAPAELFRHIIERAVANANINQRWVGLWRLFYEREFGPIEVIMELAS